MKAAIMHITETMNTTKTQRRTERKIRTARNTKGANKQAVVQIAEANHQQAEARLAALKLELRNRDCERCKNSILNISPERMTSLRKEKVRQLLTDLKIFSVESRNGNKTQQRMLASLVSEFADVFDSDLATALGNTKSVHSIRTGHAQPQRVPYYKRSHRKKKKSSPTKYASCWRAQ